MKVTFPENVKTLATPSKWFQEKECRDSGI